MIKIYSDVDDENVRYWWYTVNGKNGKVLVNSEVFDSKQGCMKGIRALLKVTTSEILEIRDETK